MNSFSKEQLLNKHELLKTEYIKLLNDKDVLEQWGKPQLASLYNTLIGYLQIEILQLQLHIKALKRKIELVHAAINQHKIVDVNEIELQVAVELAEAEFYIMNEVTKLENSKDLLNNLESPDRCAELRKLFKQLAKQLHPDVNDNLTEEQINLWHLVKRAYETGDLDELYAIQIVYEDQLNEIGTKILECTDEEVSLKIEILKESINVLIKQLFQIRTEFPFTIEAQIKDTEWVSTQKEELKKELHKLQQYESELTLQYQQIITVS